MTGCIKYKCQYNDLLSDIPLHDEYQNCSLNSFSILISIIALRLISLYRILFCNCFFALIFLSRYSSLFDFFGGTVVFLRIMS